MTNNHRSPYSVMGDVPSFTLESPDVRDGGEVPRAARSGIMGAGGEDRSPALSWSGFPEKTRSFVVTCFDPDAPTASGFWHWVVVDIPAEVTSLPANAGSEDADLPSGAFAVNNDAGFPGFVGAAPPPGHGEHRYVYAVHAVDVDELPDVDENSSPAFVCFTLFSHTLARAELTTTFEARAKA